MPRTDENELTCPSCRRAFAADERFCADCEVPLVYPAALEGATGTPVSELRRQARKVKPAYTGGRLVRVVGARTQPEGELIQGLLLEAGVPSLLQRSSGVGVRYMPGPCDVMVPEAGLQVAREVLLQSELSEER